MGKKVTSRGTKNDRAPIRYAVAGLGYIAQVAVLPAFKHAPNSKLVALISSDIDKVKKLSKKYKVEHTGDYVNFEECLDQAQVDAVYIATPNVFHRDLAIRAAAMGVHVLCEKPLATTVTDAELIVAAAKRNQVKLMTAYRLHFEAANLNAIKLVKSGKIGDIKYFTSEFSMQVKKGNIRLKEDLGGGPLFDLGIYCINAARYIMGDEPVEVMGMDTCSNDARFTEVEETFSGTLRFSGGRMASFTTSFGASDAGYYEVVGTKGKLRVEPAFEYAEALGHKLTVGGRTTFKIYGKRDQFAAELIYFSDRITRDAAVEPSGEEGLADLRVIEALKESAETGTLVAVEGVERAMHPNMNQNIERPPVREPELIHATSPSH
jgi:glucose-fructose oxidoreductase